MNRLVTLLPLLLAVSCAGPEDAPPYLVGGPESFCTEKPGAYRFAGIEFDFYNRSSLTVESFTVSCRVYTADGEKNPLNLSNGVTARFTGPVLPDERKHLCISLDSRITAIPEVPYLVEFFTIPEILYADGSVWTDPLCCYFTRSVP